MDPSDTQLGRMLLEEVTPLVMVLRTPLVEEVCLINGASFVEMLTPFCEFHNIDVPVRTSSDQPYRLQKFKLRLFYASDVRQPNPEVTKERLRKVVTNATKDLTHSSPDTRRLEDILIAPPSEIVPPWFRIFNKEVCQTLAFSEHEAFDHPVACLLVVSSKDELPVNRFIDLFNTDQLPSLLNDGVMDPKILKHYLLVHDYEDGASLNPAKIFSEMESTFGPNFCHLLCFNSSIDEFVNGEDNKLSSLNGDNSSDHPIGCSFKNDDLKEIKDFMKDLASMHIIPHMEQKVRVLNQQVSATRKGFRNQLRNLWWRKGMDDAPNLPNTPLYTFSSIESQIRVLGDYAFMLRDYELASSNYRLLSTDYKLDKAWKRYAGVQEMLGLTYFMLDQSWKEAEYCLENAFNTYLKLGSSGLQNAARCGLWWAEMLKARDELKEAAGIYNRISGEEPLHSAVMLEQASYCYLFSKPFMLRKYGFNLLLCGDIYNKLDQKIHAIRTYRSALPVYEGTNWIYLKQHVHFQIGKWYTSIGMYDVAVAHMLDALACIYQSRSTQELFLKNLFDIVEKRGKSLEVLKLQLPVISDTSLKITFEDHRTYASPASDNVGEEFWEVLEDGFVSSVPSVRSNWLDSQTTNSTRNVDGCNVCVAGEKIQVFVEISNPLRTSLSIFNASLACDLSQQSCQNETEGETTTGLQDDVATRKEVKNSDMLVLSEADFVLNGNETTLVCLSVIPVVEGALKLVGIRWKLSRHVSGFHTFNPPDVSNHSKRRSKSKRPSNSAPLNFLVVKALPKLDASISYLPEKTYMGDTRILSLVLKTLSNLPVTNMKMKVSHPAFLRVADLDALRLDFPACLEVEDDTTTESNHRCESDTSYSLFTFPEGTIVEEGSELQWPLWFRAAVAGNISLYAVIYYEIKDSPTPITYRTLRMHFTVEVLASLDVAFQINTSLRKHDEYMVQMHIMNRSSSSRFQIHQLSTVGFPCQMSLLPPLQKTGMVPPVLLPGELFTCFFKLITGTPHANSHVMFADTPVVATSRFPLNLFHAQERLQSSGDGHFTVDFILLFRNLSGVPPPTLMSHHACHCAVMDFGSAPFRLSLEGERVVGHDFSSSPSCEVMLRMVLWNWTDEVVSVRVDYGSPKVGEVGEEESWGGWRGVGGAVITHSVSPYMWSGLSCRNLELQGMATTEVPLQVTVFAAGTYDLSLRLLLYWNVLPSTKSAPSELSGTCRPHPYHFTAHQSP